MRGKEKGVSIAMASHSSERLFHDSDKLFLGRGDKRPKLVQLLKSESKGDLTTLP